MKYKIGIIGGGFVGGAVAHGFSEMSPLLYDKNPDISKNSLHEVLLQDYVFICVPTPMNTSKGGQCNTSIIDDCLQQISDIGSDAILIIKSTVPVGFTETRSKKFKNLKGGLYTFKHGVEFQYIFLQPNDSLLLRLNTWDFDESLVFSGKGAEKNNLLINKNNYVYILNHFNYLYIYYILQKHQIF